MPLRVLALALTGALPIIFVVVAIALGEEAFSADQPPWWLHAVLVLFVLGGYAVGQMIALRNVRPLDPRAPIDELLPEAVNHYRVTMILRFVFTEAPLIGLVALLFILDYGFWPAVVAAPIGIVLLALAVYPTRGNLLRVQERLEAQGARTGLVDAGAGPR